jgi:hypothetical protein
MSDPTVESSAVNRDQPGAVFKYGAQFYVGVGGGC